MICNNPRRQWPGATVLLLALLPSAAVFAASAEQPKVVAIAGGRTITEAEVDASIAAKLLPLWQQIYALRRSALDNLLARVVLEAEANRKGKSLEELRSELT